MRRRHICLSSSTKCKISERLADASIPITAAVLGLADASSPTTAAVLGVIAAPENGVIVIHVIRRR